MATVRLKARREKSLVQRHPWVYSGAIDRIEGDPAAGDVVTVVDSRGAFLATGYYNAQSKICVRVLSRVEGDVIDDAWWRARIAGAIDARGSLAADDRTTAYRLVHAEADCLPGLIVDRYGDVVVVQLHTAGTDRVRPAIVAALREHLGDVTVYERSDAAARQREGLSSSTGLLAGELSGAVDILENGYTFRVDVTGGQKTGYYLDQRDNRRIVAGYARGRNVLDAFCYTGAFAVYAGNAGAESVTLADSSASSLELAEANLTANGVGTDTTELLNGDVFEILRAYRDEGRRFGMVVLDPPRFASSRRQVEKALRAYKDANMLAMKLLEPGGILATFSCSAGVSTEAFTLAVSWAGIDAGRDVQIVRRLSQGPDHPILTSFPESEYLKGLVCRVL